MPDANNLPLILSIIGAVSGFVGPIALNLLQARQNKKKQAADEKKTLAEANEKDANAVNVVTETALTLIQPLKDELKRFQDEFDQAKMNWLNERVQLQEQISKTKREFAIYVRESDERDRQNQERIKLLTEEVEQIRSAAVKREAELLGRIEALESENHTLRRGKRPTGSLPGLATSKGD
jgi:hypothetical protein